MVITSMIQLKHNSRGFAGLPHIPQRNVSAWLHMFAAAAFLVAGVALYSQDRPTFSANVKVVNVLATVRNKKGEIVGNLSKDDFILEDNGRSQAITYFARDSDLPLTLGLLVDTSLSERRMLDQERSASHGFLDQVLREDRDRAFLIHFDRDVELLQDLTSSRQKLEAALDNLQTPSFTPTRGEGPSSPGPRAHRGGGTTLYDAVFLASDELMKKQEGRKAVVVLSDGVDRGSKVIIDRAIEAAQRNDTIVYSIYIADEQAHEGGFGGPHIGMGGGRGGWGGMGRRGGRFPEPEQSRPDGKKILQRISKETGGRFFEVSKKNSVDQIYAQIQDELRSQYNLGFSPDKTDSAPGYHKLHLAAKKKDLVVQARDGYYLE